MIDNLISVTDIENKTGINIKTKLNIQNEKVAEWWVHRQQEIILNFVAAHVWGRRAQVEECIICDEDYRDVIVNALYEQINYIVSSGMVDVTNINGVIQNSNGIQVADKNQIMQYKIAEVAKDYLLESGACYSGEGRGF